MQAFTTATAKQIPLLVLLSRLGHEPLGQARGGNHYFLSPFREESTPSFVVCEPKNNWVDFGEAPEPGKKAYGGDVLKLVMRLTGFDLRVALQALAQWMSDLVSAEGLPRAAGRTVASGAITFTDVRTEPLTWAPLVAYLTGRGIDWGLVQRSSRTLAHLQQVFYQIDGKPRPKPYFAVSWKTSGGLEVRNARFQGCIGEKGLTWLPGPEPGVVVFEGFMDYLSALTHWNKSSFSSTVLILNSVNLLGLALPQLLEHEQVHWCGDNDAAGERALNVLRQAMPGKVKAHNELYRGFKDFNDFLTGTPPTKPLPARRAEPSKQSQTQRYWLWAVFDERAPGTRIKANRKRECTFYSYTNDEDGLEQLRVLRNQLGDQLCYFRLCERTQGREFKILEWAGRYQTMPVDPEYVPPVFDESEDE
ncbi:toprim domain-containing protein [Hymenobacter sp.]|uniref:toprim domain-containing protein n=1 Tax=Hymenobacter sp. TaxID=1898978 RepID=UPI00286CB93C|nr:toprim domain-containing protein [Hymenobacter sp.]